MNNPFLLKVTVHSTSRDEFSTLFNRELLIPITNIAFLEKQTNSNEYNVQLIDKTLLKTSNWNTGDKITHITTVI